MSDRIVRYRFKIEAHEDNSKALTAIAKETAKAVKAMEADKQKSRKQGTTAAVKEEEGLTAKAKKELEKRGKALKRQLDKDMAQRERDAKQQVAQAKRAANQLAREYSAAHQKIDVGRAQMVEGFTAGTGEVAKFGRGLAALGVAGEENTQELLKSLVKIQGTFDVVTGGVNAYVKLKKAVEGYLLASRGAASLDSTARAAAIAQVRVEIAEENALAVARQRSAVAAAGSSAARIGGGAAAGAAGRAASGAAGAGAVGAGAAGGGAAIGAAGMAAAWTAAVASVVAAGTVITEALTGSSRNIDSWSMKIANWEVSMANWVGLIDDGSRGLEGFTKRMDQRNAAQMRQDESFVAELLSKTGPVIQRLSMGMDRSFSSPQDKLEHFDSLSGKADRAGNVLRGFRGNSGEVEATRLQELDKILQAEDRIARERQSAQKEILDSRRRENQEALQAAQQELSLTKQRIKATTDSLMSAKERFGNLSQQEQATLIRIQQKAQDEGVGSLTAAERGKLASVGTEKAKGFAREGAIQAADAAGFDQFFGSAERDKIAADEKKRDALQVNVEAANKIELEISRNEDALVAEVAAEVNRILDERTEIIVQRMKDETGQRIEAINRTSDDDYVARTRQAATGR